MNCKTIYKDILGKMLFLEIDKEGFCRNIKIPEDIKLENKDLYIPINSQYVTKNIKDEIKIHNLPIYYFIEGMFTALGADKNFKYNKDYGCLLSYIDDSELCVKSIIADKVKKNKLSEAFVLAKGLYEYNNEEEIMNAVLSIGETIREEHKDFADILLNEIDECKLKFYKNPVPYLYSALISRDEGDYKKAQVEIHEYLNRGGEKDEEIEAIIEDIDNIGNYEKAIEIVKDDPNKALELLLPLSEKFEENPLIYYYIGVAYRKLENYDKAIYYLLQSVQIESGILEVVNELGLNYACIEKYKEALECFEKAFEASKEVEICTNIVMCYINLKNTDKAKEYLDKAKKINAEDDIVIELDNILNRSK